PHHRGSGVAEPARRTAYARLSGQRRAQAARNSRLGGHFPPSGLLLSREAGPTRPLAAGSKRGRLLRPGTATLRGHTIGPGRTSRRARTRGLVDRARKAAVSHLDGAFLAGPQGRFQTAIESARGVPRAGTRAPTGNPGQRARRSRPSLP